MAQCGARCRSEETRLKFHLDGAPAGEQVEEGQYDRDQQKEMNEAPQQMKAPSDQSQNKQTRNNKPEHLSSSKTPQVETPSRNGKLS